VMGICGVPKKLSGRFQEAELCLEREREKIKEMEEKMKKMKREDGRE